MREMLHHAALIARREYLQRVRTKAFLFTTILFPLVIGGFALAPGYFMTQQFGSRKTLVVVSDKPALAQAVAAKLGAGASAKSQAGNATTESSDTPHYDVITDPNTTAAERAQLDSELEQKSIDGYLWLTQAALQQNKVEFHLRNVTDFAASDSIQNAVTAAAIQQRMAAHGVSNVDIDSLLKPVDLETVQAGKGAANGAAVYIFGFLLVMAMYMPVVIQVVAVMRSVIEEKTSRVMEVLLATVTPKELMAGKIVGVGAVGLTQIAIWAAAGAAITFPGAAFAGQFTQGVHFSAGMIICFPIFYLLGYLLYSAFAAAVGAAVNSDEEAQQLQFLVMLPLIASLMLIGIVFSDPGSPIAVGLSLFPFFAPILMYLRIVLEQPPLWQIALSIALLAATAYGTLAVCARIYRVGILMYGKRPTLREITKWVRYA